MLTWLKDFLDSHKINSWMFFYLLVYVVLIIKVITFEELDNNILFGVYSIAVSVYILSRFALAYFYQPEFQEIQNKYQPTITFGIPSKNEGENIRETIIRIVQSDYPKDKFDIIAINDGSTDNTLSEMLEAQKIAHKIGVAVKVIDWKINRGKRHGMAECVSQSNKEIILFIDSDSFVESNTAKEISKYFVLSNVAAVAGHAYVANADFNFLTKMQAVRYFVAFKAYKAAEAVFGSVTCCSGCCSAYRRDYLLKVLDEWLNQEFLGIRCTYGDDRSLTNYLLKKGYKALFAPEAIAYTFVPNTLKKFMKQQLRWKKSWVRESLMAGLFMWKKNPLMSISFYLGVILPLLAPIIVFRALLWYPFVTSRTPWFYLFGLFLMALIYGFYYYIYTRDKKWIYGVIFASFYTLVLIWQLPYAILSLRDSRWGTR
jgi:hyaluronan synthase